MDEKEPINPQDEVYIQRGVYEPVTWRDYLQEKQDKVPTAQQEADKQVYKIVLFLCITVCLMSFVSKYIKTEVHDFSVYKGNGGNYIVRNKEIRCPDGSVCQYDWLPDPWTGVYRFVITYPNGYQINVTPVGRGGGITTYDSNQDSKLTPYMEAIHVDVKNAMLEHHGNVTDLTPQKFLALPFLVLGMVSVFMPYKISDFATFLYITKSVHYHSFEYYSKVQKCGCFLVVASLLILIL